MSDKSKLRSQIRAAVKSKINDIAGSSWKKYFAPIPEGIYYCTTNHFGVWEDQEDVLAVVDTTLTNVCDEGLVFTTEALHYKNGYNSPEVFSYDEIEYMRVESDWPGDALLIDTGDDEDRKIDATYYKKKQLMSLLEKICDMVNA